MSSAVVARPLLRQNLRFAARRFQSTDAASAQAKKAADATKEAAQNVQSKAAQGLSRVTSAAGPALAGAANAAKGAASALGKVGGRTGRFVGFVERTSLFPSRPGRAVKGGRKPAGDMWDCIGAGYPWYGICANCWLCLRVFRPGPLRHLLQQSRPRA